MKKIFFYVFTIVILLVILDLGIGVVFYALKRFSNEAFFYKFFDQSKEYNQYILENKDYFDSFLSEYYDPVTGWNTPRSKYLKSHGCYGKWEANYYADGSRKTCNDYASSEYEIIFVGDSFTHGDEADDCTTYPSFVQKYLQVNVGNFGVFAFNSIQSVLQYEIVLSKISSPRIGVLGIVFENGRRNLNSFFPLFFNNYNLHSAYFFSPHYDGHQVVDPVIKNKNNFENYKKQANYHYKHGYWSKPDFRFPFSLSLIQFLNRPYIKIYFFQYLNKLLNKPIYSYDYELPIILGGVKFSIDKFITISNRYNVKPVIMFIPACLDDLTSPNNLINELKYIYPEALFLNFGDHDMNWSEYKKSRYCHPTTEGYSEMAIFFSNHIINVVE